MPSIIRNASAQGLRSLSSHMLACAMRHLCDVPVTLQDSLSWTRSSKLRKGGGMTQAWISVPVERQILLRDLAQVTSSPYWSSLKNKTALNLCRSLL